MANKRAVITLSLDGHTGVAQWHDGEGDKCWGGKLAMTKGLYLFQGDTLDELHVSFVSAVEGAIEDDE